MTTGQAIQVFRKKAKMKQTEVEEKLDLPFTCISRIEQGRTKLDLDRFFRLCKLFNTSPCEVIKLIDIEE